MTQDEIIRMATEAGLMQVHSCCNVPAKLCNLDVWQGNIQDFFALAFAAGAAHERDKYLDKLAEAIDLSVKAEREACVKVCKSFGNTGEVMAAAIRARSEK